MLSVLVFFVCIYKEEGNHKQLCNYKLHVFLYYWICLQIFMYKMHPFIILSLTSYPPVFVFMSSCFCSFDLILS